MLPLVPAMMMLTLVVSMNFMNYQRNSDESVSRAIFNDMVLAHGLRVDDVFKASSTFTGFVTLEGESGHSDGNVFKKHGIFRTYAFVDKGLQVVMTWRDNGDGAFHDKKLLSQAMSVAGRRVFSGKYEKNTDGGGRIGVINVPPLPTDISDGVPILVDLKTL